MSLSSILGSAMSGLNASQAGMAVVSNNIANVGTPGYSRETATLSTAVTAGAVSGVAVGETSRIADRFLEATIARRASDMGSADVTATYLDRLQATLGAPGAESGLAARLDAIGASAVTMSGSQASAQTGAAFVANVQDAIGSLQQLDSDVAGLQANAESEVGDTVGTINTLLKRIHDLNSTVANLQGLNRSSAGATDQRAAAITELSGFIKVTVREQPDGRVTIDSASGASLIDKRLRQLSYPSSGSGTAQSSYPPIDVRFADDKGVIGASTGEKIESAAAGGKLGGLLDLRDAKLPAFSEKLGVLFDALSRTLNAASNAGTAVPAPVRLSGGQTGLIGSDRLGMTGAAVFAVTKASGELVARTTIDFSGLGAAATVDDAVAAINAGLGSNASASFVDGRLVITAAGAGNGVTVAQGTPPSGRGGSGFSQYFGLNDLIKSPVSSLVPSGFIASDPHGFATGQTAELVLRDASGRKLTSYTLTGAGGTTFGDLVVELNSSPLGDYGSFVLDSLGRFQFKAGTGVPGASLAIVSDSTSRDGTGRSFSSLSNLPGISSGLEGAGVRPDILVNAALLPLARLQADAVVGAKALGAGDNRGAAGFLDALGMTIDLGKDGMATIGGFSASLLGGAGADAAQAAGDLANASARRDDAVNRRDNYSGVNIDEELAQMVVLQKSYSASGRIVASVGDMYDTLIAMIR